MSKTSTLINKIPIRRFGYSEAARLFVKRVQLFPYKPHCFPFAVKPYIINKDAFKNIIIKKNQVIVLDIQYGGEPDPEVHWYRNQTELFEDTEK